ncbi:hypothetical protein [Sphaerisporangium perillae]|uniref:hypothetical protein n=1 Tax=Sphaerisporangium perillae TaxID=2935860 RepID=UPI00200E66D8|nr:hypothetical protein [Sphaerisporangium perillae]
MRNLRETLLCTAVIMALGCADADQTRPSLEGDGGFGTGMWKSVAGQPYLFGDMPLCLDRRGTVVVESVRFENPQGGIRLESFALRPAYRPAASNGTGGGQPITLRDKGIPEGPRAVTEVCRPPDSLDQRFSELVVQVSHTGEATGFSPELIVTYTSNGHRQESRLPVEFSFCGPKKYVGERCVGAGSLLEEAPQDFAGTSQVPHYGKRTSQFALHPSHGPGREQWNRVILRDGGDHRRI